MDRLRVEDVHFKERIFSTWCNFVHFRRASTARGNVLARPSRPWQSPVWQSGRHLFIHLTTLSGTTTALSLCPWPACPTVQPYSGRWADKQTDRQSCLRWHFLQATFFAQLLIIWSEIYFILSDSSRHLAFWNEFFFFLSSRLVAAWLPLGVVVIFNSISFSHLSQLALPNSLPVYNCPSSLILLLLLRPAWPTFAHSIWRHIYSPFFGVLFSFRSHFNFNYFVTCRTAPTQSHIFHFLLAWPTLRIRNADCLRFKQCDNVDGPWGAGISISII